MEVGRSSGIIGEVVGAAGLDDEEGLFDEEAVEEEDLVRVKRERKDMAVQGSGEKVVKGLYAGRGVSVVPT